MYVWGRVGDKNLKLSITTLEWNLPVDIWLDSKNFNFLVNCNFGVLGFAQFDVIYNQKCIR